MLLTVFVALCAHGGGYGPCGDSTLALQSALVRAPSSPPWCIQSIMPSAKKARLGRTGKGAKSKEGTRNATKLAARELEADRRASLEPPELDEEVGEHVGENLGVAEVAPCRARGCRARCLQRTFVVRDPLARRARRVPRAPPPVRRQGRCRRARGG
jgi:hypothetical protein